MINQSHASDGAVFDEKNSSTIDIGVYDVHLPCRQYRINFKVAELGKVSLTTEFLLRLVHAVDGMYEADAADFFGFSDPEMSYLLNEAVSLGYINREAGKLWMTLAGSALFVQDSEYPQIFDVEDNSLNCGFDLISFSYQEKSYYDTFDSDVYELNIDPVVASEGTKHVVSSFKKNFREITSQHRLNSHLNKSLYSIDEVSPGNRFLTVIPIMVKAEKGSPSRGEPDLSKWRSEDEMEQRQQIMPAVAKFMDELQISLPRDSKDQYQFLYALAPELMKNYFVDECVSATKFYKEVISLKSDAFRRNNTIVPIVGSMFNKLNIEFILRGISSKITHLSSDKAPNTLYWLAPFNWHWGRTSVLPEFLGRVSEILSSKFESDTKKVSTILIRNGKFRAPDRVFSKVEVFDQSELPRNAEILLIPDVCAAVLIHLPVNQSHGHAVPLGFITIDPAIILKTQEELSKVISIDTHEVPPSCDDENNKNSQV
ncbi:hypothetical protein ACRARH_07045 [Phytobacter ursingii]